MLRPELLARSECKACAFDVDLNAKKLGLYFIFYGFSYLLGRSVLYLCVDLAGIDKYPAILIVTLVGIPVNFVGSRLVLRGSLRA